MADGVIDSLSIEIGASSNNAVRSINNIRQAFENLHTTIGSIKMGEFKRELGKLGNREYATIEKLTNALSSLKGIKLSKTISENISKIAESCDKVTDSQVSNMIKFGDALQHMNGVKISINDKLGENLQYIAIAAEGISESTLANLERMTKALSNLQGVDLRGFTAAANKAKKDAEKVVKEVKDGVKTKSAGGKIELDIFSGVSQGSREAMSEAELMQKKLDAMRKDLQQKIDLGKIDDKGIADATLRIKKLEEEIRKVQEPKTAGGSKTFQNLMAESGESLEKIDLLKAKLVEMRAELRKKIELGKIDDKGVITATENIKKLQKEIEKLEQKDIGSQFKNMFKASDSSFNEKWGWSLKNNLGAVGRLLSSHINPAFKLAASIVGGIAKGVWNIAKAAWNVAKGIAKWAFHTAINALKKIWSLMQQVAKTAVKIGVNMFKGMAKYVTEVGKGVANISRNLARFMWAHSPIKKLTDSFANLKKVVSSLGRVAFYRLVRSAIKAVTDSLKEGSENAYFFSKKFGDATAYIAERLDELSTANFKMKNQVGAAWATLLATIEPILLRLLELVTKAASVVTQFFGAMGGKATYLKAKSYPQEWAEDAEEAAEKTKEWKNQLMGFDTLNRLNEQNDSDSGIDEKIKDYSEMFEEVPIEPWITNLSDLIIDIGKLNLDDWFKTGIDLAGKLNDLLKKLDDWILKLAPDLKNAAKNLASLLNGLIEGTDWELLGKTVGDGLNAIFGAIDEFLTSVKWKELGRGLGTALKSMIDTVDWKLVGKTFADAWNAFMYVIEGIVTTPGLWKSIGKAFGDMVRSFIDNIDIDSMATSLIAILNGVSDMISGFLGKNPFKNLASKLTNAFERVIDEVKWGRLGSMLGALFQSVLDVIHDVIMETRWKDFGTAIGTSIRNFLAEIDAGELGQTLVGVITSALDFVYGMITTPGFMTQLATSLHDFFIGALGQFEEWLKSVEPTDVANAIRDFFNNLKADEIKDSFVRVVKLAWEKAMAVKEELFPEGLLATITNHLVEYFNSLEWEKLKTTITENAKKMWTAAWETLDAIWPPEKRLEFLHQLASTLLEIIYKAVQWVIDHRQAIHNVVAYMLDVIVFGEDKANSMWRKKGEFAGSDLILGTEYGIQSRSDALDKAVQGYIVDPVSEALYQMEQEGKTSGANTVNEVANEIAAGQSNIETAIDNAIGQPTRTFKDWFVENLPGAGRSGVYGLAQSILGEQDTVMGAIDSALVQPAETKGNWFTEHFKNLGKSSMRDLSSAINSEKSTAINAMDNSLVNAINDVKHKMEQKGKTAGTETIKSVAAGVKSAKSGLDTAIGSSLKDPFTKQYEKIKTDAKTTGSEIVKVFTEGIRSSKSGLENAIGASMKEPLERQYKKLAEDSKAAGSNTAKGFEQGYTKEWEAFLKKKPISDFIKSVKSELGVHSPSTVFEAIGKSVMEGFKNGFSTGMKQVQQEAKRSMDDLRRQFLQVLKPALDQTARSFSSNFQSMSSSASRASSNISNSMSRIVSSCNNAISALNRLASAQSRVSTRTTTVRAYASGGFPEEGPFYMNQGEIAGHFSNGKSVVANNQQITEGIAEAVYGAFVRAFTETGGNGSGGQHVAILQVNGREFARATYNDQQAVAKEKGMSLITNFA